MYFLGIDIGSLSCDAVLLDENRNIVSSSVVPTGVKNIEAIAHVKRSVLEKSGIMEQEIKSTVSTGYGRNRVPGRSGSVTEITCHARGIRHMISDTRIVIDIGGQDSKAIFLDGNGKVDMRPSFQMEKLNQLPFPDISSLGKGERDTIHQFYSGVGHFIIIDDGKGAKYCRDIAIKKLRVYLRVFSLTK